ncbi:MAG: ABC transporter permease [Methylobacteriaceae bacterium]|jgi:cell division transport system permease protein|nr:ABC transporter permease [Methylobacteriaceae bacterium]
MGWFSTIGNGLFGPRDKTRETLRRNAPLVPIDSSSGRALAAVIAILTFLAALCAVGAEQMAAVSEDWRSDVSREITIQIRPTAQRDMDQDIARTVALTRELPEVVDTQVFSEAESLKLLEPWLGTGPSVKELPIPRMVTVKIVRDSKPDFSELRRKLAEQVPNANLNDHNQFLRLFAAMANTVVLIGAGIVLLVLIATGLAVTFATRGAMVGNREVVEVLHFVGATNEYIAREFQHRFFQLGLKGSLWGAAWAVAFWALLGFLSPSIRATAAGMQMEHMFGTLNVNGRGVVIVLFIAIIVALLTGVVSRLTVRGYLSKTTL